MLTTLMILSPDQGRLAPAPRRIGQFDARLLEDLGFATDTQAVAAPLPVASRPRSRRGLPWGGWGLSRA